MNERDEEKSAKSHTYAVCTHGDEWEMHKINNSSI